MPPANQILIVTGPRGELVLGVADKACGAKPIGCEPRCKRRLSGHQHQLAAHVFPGVVALGSASADIDEVSRHAAAVAVFGEHHRLVFETCDAQDINRFRAVASYFPELGKFRIPRRPRFLGAVHGVTVGRNFNYRDTGQAKALQL